MVKYRRGKLASPDAVYFLTLVTEHRKGQFRRREDFVLLWQVMSSIAQRFDMEYPAWVLMPNHLHWLLNPRCAAYSKAVFAFKRAVGAEYKRKGLLETGQTLWQSRYWEHTIRDQADYTRCVEYVHFNPVKHGLVASPIEWPYSSFREYVRRGLYPSAWAAGSEVCVAGAEYDP